MKRITNSMLRAVRAPITRAAHVRDAIKLHRQLHALKKLPPHRPQAAFEILRACGLRFRETPDRCVLCVEDVAFVSCLPYLERATECAWTLCTEPSLWNEDVVGISKNLHIRRVLEESIRLKASDCFVALAGRSALVSFRCRRMIQNIKELPYEDGLLLLRSFLVLGNLNFSETFENQEGHFRYNLNGRVIFGRISYLTDGGAQSLTLRLLSEQTLPFQIDALHFPPQLRAFLETEISKQRSGMILISGPTGSGKTTTLYALGRLFAQRGLKLISLEDPVEAEIDDWVQTEIDIKNDLTFEEALTGTLRQDPDSVMIGEIRDIETAKTAFYASLSGFLVLTPIHCRWFRSAVKNWALLLRNLRITCICKSTKRGGLTKHRRNFRGRETVNFLTNKEHEASILSFSFHSPVYNRCE